MLSALIHDIDGTPLDSNAAHVEAWVDAFAAHGYRIPAERCLALAAGEAPSGAESRPIRDLAARAAQSRTEAVR